MQITNIQAIDVHGHYGIGHDEFTSADATTVASRAAQVNIKITIVSPFAGLLPRGQALSFPANEEAAQTVAQTEGLLQWVIVHPLQPQTYQQAEEMLLQPQCVGIKIHPEEHKYSIRDHGKALFSFAAQHDAVVLVHSGDENSLPIDFVPFANAHSNVKIILAHLGNGGSAKGDSDLQVRAIQNSRHENLFVDTSSACSITPGLIEWAVQEIGAEKILFGTDTPLYFTAMQRARIDYADITEEDKLKILCENAERILAKALLGAANRSC